MNSTHHQPGDGNLKFVLDIVQSHIQCMALERIVPLFEDELFSIFFQALKTFNLGLITQIEKHIDDGRFQDGLDLMKKFNARSPVVWLLILS